MSAHRAAGPHSNQGEAEGQVRLRAPPTPASNMASGPLGCALPLCSAPWGRSTERGQWWEVCAHAVLLSHASCRATWSLCEPAPVPSTNQSAHRPLGTSLRGAAGVLPTLVRNPIPCSHSPRRSPFFLEPLGPPGLCPGPRSHVCVSAQPAVELYPGRRRQGPGTSTTAQHEPDQP